QVAPQQAAPKHVAPTPQQAVQAQAQQPAAPATPAKIITKISKPRLQASAAPRPSQTGIRKTQPVKPVISASVGAPRRQPRPMSKAKLAEALKAPKKSLAAIPKVTTRAAPPPAKVSRLPLNAAATPILRKAIAPSSSASLRPRKESSARAAPQKPRPSLKVGAALRLPNHGE
ncbi:MAG: hypothetical protein JKY92_09285, partial [Magnetovibrio sp.]|nr:hypothetical protein [Magnetovibrio sp.]